MEILKSLLFFGSLVLILSSCEISNSKSSTWNDQQKAEWTEKCMEFMVEGEVDKDDAKSFCDCMLEKTSDKYTPEEAKNITTKQEQEIWQDCDYQW